MQKRTQRSAGPIQATMAVGNGVRYAIVQILLSKKGCRLQQEVELLRNMQSQARIVLLPS